MARDYLKLQKGTVLQGKITDLFNYLVDGWRRRDITVWQEPPGGCPKVGDEIILIDTEGDRYQSKFTEPEENGHVCLGKPKNLEKWLKKHYPHKQVVLDQVYLEHTGVDAEFLIFTSGEWANKKAKLAVDFRSYYHLESYLFDTVRPRFTKQGYLMLLIFSV